MKTPLKKPATKPNDKVRVVDKTQNTDIGPTSDILSKKPLKKTKVLWKATKKKKPVRTATARQQKAIDILDEKVAKGGKVVLAEIARDAGYSEALARNPKRIFGAWIVQSELKKIWVDSKWTRVAHEYLMNTRVKHVMRFASDIDPKSVIKRYTKEFPWFRCFNYFLDWEYYEFECSMPNDANVRAAMEFSAKYYPPQQWDSKQLRDKATDKRKNKIRAISEKLGFHLKNPIKLWAADSSPSQN